jgi:DNA-binding transcriptional MerR regulator
MKESMITISEASKISGKSPSTLRRWVDNKFINATKTEQGRLIEKKSLLLKLSQETLVLPSQKESSTTNEVLQTLHDNIRDRDETIKYEREQNRELRAQLKQSHEEILKLTYEIKAILTKDEPRGISRWIKTNVKEALSQF